jgi:two-component system chemotaxis response regulator CheY
MVMGFQSDLETSGFIVETANDGLQALNKIKAGTTPDLIIIDISMPNMDGLELIRNIKGLVRFRFKPIIVLYTETQAAKRNEARKLGATGWMVKPVDAKSLVEVIKKLLPGT